MNEQCKIVTLGKFTPELMQVHFDGVEGRMQLDKNLTTVIDEKWQSHSASRAALGLPCSNGDLVRLASLEKLKKEGVLEFSLSLTDFREFAATRSQDIQGNWNRSDLANPLAVAATIVTADDRILVGRRLKTAHIHPNKYFIFGGFVEPDDLSQPAPLFYAIQREIEEETSIRPKAILEMICTGVNYDLVVAHPEVAFTVKIAHRFADVAAMTPKDKEIVALEYIENRPEIISRWLTKMLAEHELVGTAAA